MLCEKCNKKKASVFYHENINGKSRMLHLCGECATAMQRSGELEDLSSAFARFSSPFSLLDDGLFGYAFPLSAERKNRPAATVSPTQKCPTCGMTSGDLMTTGRMGCATCYETFRNHPSLALSAAHGRVAYVGQVPRRFRIQKERAGRLEAMKKQLQEAIATENYEEAAALRDRIRQAETEA